MVRTANALIDLGKVKALLAIDEAERTSGVVESLRTSGVSESLMRLVFEVPNPPGYPKHWQPNFMLAELKPEFRKRPRFPMIVFDDIPFEVTLGGFITSGPGWGSALPRYRKFPIRMKHLRPPDDPFLTCAHLFASDEWPFPKHAKSDERFPIPYREKEGEALKQVLSLVFDVYQPIDFRSVPFCKGLDLEKYHRGFLKLGAYWDDRLQRYVRRDGVTLAERPNPPAGRWDPPDFNHMRAHVTLQRYGVSRDVSAEVEVKALGGGSTLPEVLRVIDVHTGKLLEWVGIWETDSGSRSRKTPSAFLAGRARRDGAEGGASRSLTLRRGAAVRVELATHDRVIRRPVFRP